MSGPALELTKLCKEYRLGRGRPVRRALNDVSYTMPHGEWRALLGPNGSGKSTLMRVIATLDSQTSGEVKVFGLSAPREFAEIRRKLGVVFQQPGLDKVLTVEENLRTQGALVGMPRTATSERMMELSRRFGFHERLHDRVSKLSGGLARRVDLARALLNQPELLLLDEPTAGLDLGARRAFFELIRDLRAQQPFSILMSTHLMEEAEHADVVVFLADGRIVASGSPSELRTRYGEETILSAPLSAEPILKSHDLILRRVGAEVAATGPVRAVRAASSELLERAIQFRFGPTTLGDAYLAATGSTLIADADVTDSQSTAVGVAL